MMNKSQLQMKCLKCGNPIKETSSWKYGRFSDNEHPLSPIVFFCSCGNVIEVQKKVYGKVQD